jgi:hypothetical protein
MLLWAAARGDLGAVSEICVRGADLAAVDYDGVVLRCTALTCTVCTAPHCSLLHSTIIYSTPFYCSSLRTSTVRLRHGSGLKSAVITTVFFVVFRVVM